MLLMLGINAYKCSDMNQSDPVADLFDRVRKSECSMAEVCRRAKIDPTTPSRWKRSKNGANIGSVRRLSAALDEIISEKAGAKDMRAGPTARRAGSPSPTSARRANPRHHENRRPPG